MMMTMMITVVMYGTWDGKGVLWLKMGARRLIHQPLVSSGWHAQTRPRNNLNHRISLLVGCLAISNVLKPTRLTPQVIHLLCKKCANNIHKVVFRRDKNCTCRYGTNILQKKYAKGW